MQVVQVKIWGEIWGKVINEFRRTIKPSGDKISNQEFNVAVLAFAVNWALMLAETDVILIWMFAPWESQNSQSFLPQKSWIWMRNCFVAIGQTLAQGSVKMCNWVHYWPGHPGMPIWVPEVSPIVLNLGLQPFPRMFLFIDEKQQLSSELCCV